MSDSNNQLAFLHDNGVYFPGIKREQDLHDHLPAAVYKVTQVPRGQTMVTALAKLREKFTLPEKLYGKESEEIYNLLVDDFRSHNRGTSAMLYGHKGSGKSVIAERIANYALSAGMPVLYYDKPIDYEELQYVMMLIGPCCVIADEFLKHNADFDKDGDTKNHQSSQHPLLTLLSNQDLPKFFMILLDNTANGLSDYLINRPDRIRWLIKHTFDRCEVFDEMVKDMPIQDILKRYLRVYFSNFTDDDGGYDVMRMVVNKATGVTTVEEFVAKMKHWNVPKANFPSVELYLDDIWNNRRQNNENTNAGVDLKIVNTPPGGFPIVKIKNHGDSEFLDADQELTIDFNALIDTDWLFNATSGKSKGTYLSSNDIDFSISVTTSSTLAPTHNIGGFPFMFSVVPPRSRQEEKAK